MPPNFNKNLNAAAKQEYYKLETPVAAVIGDRGVGQAANAANARTPITGATYKGTDGGSGVDASSDSGSGINATSKTGEGVHAETASPTMAAVAGYNRNTAGTGAAIYGETSSTAGLAGLFRGKVQVTGEITADKDVRVGGNIMVSGDVLLTGADCAEEFDLVEGQSVDGGTVMVLGEEGALQASFQAYDKRVAGVTSGAGKYKPGIILDKREIKGNRTPVALMGKVYCKVDAGYAPIVVGDLLTTSNTPGHAMKAADPLKAFGSVVGKALRPLKEGQGLIPILVALQ